jgi:UDP-N-acetylmuramoyl-tripeptide--D-alanyl-D-alanine ligase
MSTELKIKSLTAEEIAAATEGTVKVIGAGAGPAKYVSIDSRDCREDCLFCCIPGERFDGHAFMNGAYANGARIFLASRIPDNFDDGKKNCFVVLVDDTIRAFGALARAYKKLTHVKTIAVTGSVGKTTTKEFIYAVASEAFKTHKTVGNHNNEIGLPLTLFSLAPDDEVSVIEMGMSGFGEIEYMSRLVEPDIAVITNIGTSHLEMLGTRENIAKAKMEIIAGMHGGTLILNADEPLLSRYATEPLPEYEGAIAPEVRFTATYNRTADYRALNVRYIGAGLVYDMIADNRAITNVEVPALGRHNVGNSMYAFAVGLLLGMTDLQIRRGLMRFEGAEMRQRIREVGDITVIEDCYNASPESMRAGIDVLVAVAAQKHGRPAALLGDMRELGENSRLMHDQIGAYAAQMKVEVLFAYGLRADVIAEAAIKKGIRADNVYVSLDTSNPQPMAKMIAEALRPGDVLLVKASRAVAAERVVECLKRIKEK